VVARHLGELAAEGAVAGTDDPPGRGDAVRLGDGGRVHERSPELLDLVVEVRVERQLLRHNEWSDEDDPRAAVCGEPAGEVESVLRLGATEQRYDDAPVADGGRPARQPAGLTAKRSEVRPAHQSSW
jgi:hypothetical protein